MALCGIYAILNLVNGKFYIGSSHDIYKRWHSHKSALNWNYHDNQYLQNAWNKYGEINFILVLLELTWQQTLEEREQCWIDQLRPFDKNIGYNSRLKANNNFGFRHSDATKDKISKSKMFTITSEATKIKQRAASPFRDKDKWPCEKGHNCKCEDCKEKNKIRNREHMREWRAQNREKYNQYMRDRRKRQNG